MRNVNIVETGNRFGNMNGSAFPASVPREQRRDLFWQHRVAVGEAYGFDPCKMFMADQTDKNGSYFEITRDYVEANPKGWTDIAQDILIVTDKVPGVVIGHPVADCPVVMIEDVKQGVTAIGHCSAELIDKKMPMMVKAALQEAYDSNDDDIIAYVSACAGSNWTYNNYPKFAMDARVWDGAIKEEDGIFRIDVRTAVARQLKEAKVLDVRFNYDDTITHPGYYSNNASSIYGLNDPSKYGRNFAGVFYGDIEHTVSDSKKFVK